MIRLNEEGTEELWNGYDTMQLLYAVDALDQVRYVIGDDEDFRPPEIRRQSSRFTHQHLNSLAKAGSI